jgi:hypothetical protein|tara:strand:+ start:1233 stop:1565 length:333 start_codon:yes stop_codon:yes gene_type:complete
LTSSAKRKGYTLEKNVETFWKDLGVPCKRILGSGAFKHYSKNLASDVNLNGYKVECKRRKTGTGFMSLYNWFKQDDADILVLHSDRQERLYVFKESKIAEIVKPIWKKEK